MLFQRKTLKQPCERANKSANKTSKTKREKTISSSADEDVPLAQIVPQVKLSDEDFLIAVPEETCERDNTSGVDILKAPHCATKDTDIQMAEQDKSSFENMKMAAQDDAIGADIQVDQHDELSDAELLAAIQDSSFCTDIQIVPQVEHLVQTGADIQVAVEVTITCTDLQLAEQENTTGTDIQQVTTATDNSSGTDLQLAEQNKTSCTDIQIADQDNTTGTDIQQVTTATDNSSGTDLQLAEQENTSDTDIQIAEQDNKTGTDIKMAEQNKTSGTDIQIAEQDNTTGTDMQQVTTATDNSVGTDIEIAEQKKTSGKDIQLAEQENTTDTDIQMEEQVQAPDKDIQLAEEDNTSGTDIQLAQQDNTTGTDIKMAEQNKTSGTDIQIAEQDNTTGTDIQQVTTATDNSSGTDLQLAEQENTSDTDIQIAEQDNTTGTDIKMAEQNKTSGTDIQIAEQDNTTGTDMQQVTTATDNSAGTDIEIAEQNKTSSKDIQLAEQENTTDTDIQMEEQVQAPDKDIQLAEEDNTSGTDIQLAQQDNTTGTDIKMAGQDNVSQLMTANDEGRDSVTDLTLKQNITATESQMPSPNGNESSKADKSKRISEPYVQIFYILEGTRLKQAEPLYRINRPPLHETSMFEIENIVHQESEDSLSDYENNLPLSEYAKQLFNYQDELKLSESCLSDFGDISFSSLNVSRLNDSSPKPSSSTSTTFKASENVARKQASRKAKARALHDMQDLSFSDDSSGLEYEPPKKMRFNLTDTSDSESDVNKAGPGNHVTNAKDGFTGVKPTQINPTQVNPTQVNPTQVNPTQVNPTLANPALVNTTVVNPALFNTSPGTLKKTTTKQISSERKSRVRKRNPEMWKSEIRKRLRNEGKEYMNSKGKRVAQKTSKRVSCKCKYRCYTITDEDRLGIFDAYWKLGYERQRDFIKQNVKQTDKARSTNKCQESRRQNSLHYFIPVNDQKIQVCKKVFLGVLCIGEKTVYYTIAKRRSLHSTDKRGRSTPSNKRPDEQKQYVREHIESFPKVPSHYCRATSQREYLASNLSVNKMYELYVQECKRQNRMPLKRHVYGHIFRNDFNLGFHISNKDTCAFCSSYENMNSKDKQLNAQQFNNHIRRKTEVREQKAIDKAKATENENITVINFDLQKVLITPKCNVSEFYYSRKLATYNFSVYELVYKNVKCYMWNESIAKRGSCEIASCIYDYNSTLGAKEEVVYYSDSCTGQQRNLQFSIMCLYSVINLPIQQLTHNYFERGHSQMEGDSVHAVIEKATKHSTIFTPAEWMAAVRNAKRTEPKYNVKAVDKEFVKDFKNLADTVVSNRARADDGSKVLWNKIHSFQYRKSHPEKIFFKYELSEDDYSSFTISRISARSCRKINLKGVGLTPLYTSAVPLADAKYKDLLQLCNKGLIRQQCQEFFRNLPSSSTVKETLPEPDEDDVSDSEE